MIDLYRKKAFSTRPCRWYPDSFFHRRRVRRHAGEGAVDRGDQIDRRRRIVNVPAGEGVGDDHAGSVDTQMELLPATDAASAMFHGGPFPFARDRSGR